jgi:DNA invertase Pin-like site-specific DNA recombinase
MKKTRKPAAVAYARTSTDRQTDEGFGLDVQEKAVRTYCRANGLTLTTIYRDEGRSGSLDAGSRSGLADALCAIETGEASVLVVPKLDRLARKLHVQEAVLSSVWRNLGAVHSADVGEILQDDPDDPMRTAMRQMMGVFAELERGMIGCRLRAGRKIKAERGGFAYGSPGYGYRAENKSLVIDPAEAEAVKFAKRLRNEGKSYRQIADALTQHGYKPKRAKVWYPSTVKAVVNSGAAE